MGWTPLFLQMDEKNVLIVGAGEVGSRRALRFLKAGASVIIIGKNCPEELKELGAVCKPVVEVEKWIKWSDIVVVATGDHELNKKVADLASNKLLNRADYPEEGDLIVPSSFFIGDVQLCIFTGGKSPLMAKELRKKIQNVIKEEDILQLELQNFTRNILKEKVDDQKKRRYYLYEILNDENISELLNEGNLNGAKNYVKRYLNSIM
ncbi:MAG TPA: bifunctional precorrin-2 dehydrogenase/sirohydrochlorin ferrochelatase [Methanobacterium sp.]|nr:bifunctional precorrin-2 dehydrogenase/sirohydrochlorin ferrochelatase [Methanobacterium sp.]